MLIPFIDCKLNKRCPRLGMQLLCVHTKFILFILLQTGHLHLGYKQSMSINITHPDISYSTRVYEEGSLVMPSRAFFKGVELVSSGNVSSSWIQSCHNPGADPGFFFFFFFFFWGGGGTKDYMREHTLWAQNPKSLSAGIQGPLKP